MIISQENSDLLHMDDHDTSFTADFSSYSPATVLMFAMSSMGVALAVVPVLLPSTDMNVFIEYMAYSILRTISSVVVTVMCLCLVIYKRNLIKLGLWPGIGNFTDTGEEGSNKCSWLFRLGSSSSHFDGSQAKYMMFTTIVFGICSIVRCVLRLLFEVSFDLTVPAIPYINHVTDILSLCSQMLFFYFYNGDILPNIRGLHYTIAFLISIKLCTWVGVTLIPLWDLETDDLFNASAPNVNENLEFSEEFFETFYTEFHTIAIGVLFYVWHSMEKFEQPKKALQKETQTITAPLLGDEYQPENLVNDDAEERREKRHKVIAILLSIILSVIYATLSLLIAKGHMLLTPAKSVYSFRGIGLVYFGGAGTMTVLQLYRLRSQPDIVLPFFNSSEYVLLFTACSDVMFNFLRIVATIGYFVQVSLNQTIINETSSLIDTHEHMKVEIGWAVLILVYSTVVVSTIWTQTMLLIVARRKHISVSVQHVLIFIACFNFAAWLQNAVRLGLGRSDDTPNLLPVMNWFFGFEKTRIIIIILLPMVVLFRFHSAIVAVELVHESKM